MPPTLGIRHKNNRKFRKGLKTEMIRFHKPPLRSLYPLNKIDCRKNSSRMSQSKLTTRVAIGCLETGQRLQLTVEGLYILPSFLYIH